MSQLYFLFTSYRLDDVETEIEIDGEENDESGVIILPFNSDSTKIEN